MDRYFWHLSKAQEEGQACVLCGANYRRMKIPSVEVGKVPETEAPVYACAEPCAERIAAEAESMAREMREAAAEMGAGWDTSASDQGELGEDGHFGSMLRDLRALVGTESLLAVTDDIDSLRFLLSITARHAEAAMIRARLLLARTMSGDG
ncbi:hypothetical protein [Streptomyces afghaniensis]|uniref:hypothetical protein n=1 Tax=Streptomyces afghaniensis TaxID=66865 RepID=UPI0037AE1323